MIDIPFNINYKDKIVVITGAGGIIGSVISKAFAKCGAKVVALGQNEQKLELLTSQIQKDGYFCKAYKVNLLDEQSIKDAREIIAKEIGVCDILINGAGGNDQSATTDIEFHYLASENDKTFFDLSLEGIDKVFKLNFNGTLLTIREFCKDMIKKGGGTILNISSMNAYCPLTKIPVYSAAKSGISNLTMWLATYFARSNIRCNAIAPGFIVSLQNKDLLFNKDGSPTNRSIKILNKTPTNRFVNAEELIGATLFLCDDNSASAITGIVLPIDAGFSAYSGV